MTWYCDYDAIVHYPPGEFASKFAENLEEKLELTEWGELEVWQIESFLDGRYEMFISREAIVMYRFYGKYQKNEGIPRGETASGAGLNGRFVSTEFAESCVDAKIRLPINLEWKNTKMYEAKLNIGIVAPITLPKGTVLSGGTPQILLPLDWSEEWIQGYRRVSGRHLQVEPTYWSIRSEEIALGKESLYPGICPRCCYGYTRKLKSDAQITIRGSKRHY